MERQSGEIEAMSGWSRERCDRLSGVLGSVTSKAYRESESLSTPQHALPRHERDGKVR